MPISKFAVFMAAASVAVAAQTAEARVIRFVVEERVPFAPGTNWGKAGGYERLRGTAYMEVDPADPLNSVIVNLVNAPRNARGMVEFSSTFVITKPVDMRRGNGKIWYGINNRGRCFEPGLRGDLAVTAPGSRCAPAKPADIGGHNLLLEDGYTVVDAGWHGDGPPNTDFLYAKFPVARQPDGSSIVGRVRLEYSVEKDAFTRPLISGWRAYEPADTDTAKSTLTVRDRADGPRTTVSPDRWTFGRCANGQASLDASKTDLCLFDGFKANKVYELVYPAKDPIVMGLAFAVTRDIASFLRYAAQDDAGNANPLALGKTNVGIKRAYSSGTSSTGMYQREFLYLGFNEDESHRKVFDGATVFTGGTHRLFANVQFAHPTLYSRQDANSDYTSNAAPPFTYAVTVDPLTGIRDGIAKRPATDPLIIQIDEETSFWQWKGSLNVVDAAGNAVPVPDNVRLYFMNGFGHTTGAGLMSPAVDRAGAEHMTGQVYAMLSPLRAFMRIMDDWADRGIAPPKSNYPGKDDLVTLEQFRAAFPAIPKMKPPQVMNQLDVLDFGPLFDSRGGIQEILPPKHGARYPLLVPRPRADGDGAAGIGTLQTRAPLGTNTGWNPSTGARAGELHGLDGSFVPLAKTRAERLSGGDSRPSLEERYTDHAGFGGIL